MAQEDQFEPDQSSLRSSPIRCPRCGEALPQEPELMAPDEAVHTTYPNDPRVRYQNGLRRVEIFGGESGYSEADPFPIRAEEVQDVSDVARWMARIAGKPWAHGEEFFDSLGGALCLALAENRPAEADV